MRRDGVSAGSTPPAPVVAVLRRRWPWIAAATVVGAALGLLGTSDTAYEATAVLRLEPSAAADGVRAQQQAQTLEQVVRSAGVLAPAATASGTSTDDLRARTTVTLQPGTSLVDVVVVADSADAAVSASNAVAAAAVEASRESAAVRAQALREEADRVLDDEQLTDPTAEDARRARLGSATADAQAEAVVSSGSVAVADAATSAVAAGLSPAMGLVLGAVGAALLAGALALAVGAARLRPRRAGQLAALAPDLDVRPLATAPDLAAVLVETQQTPLVVVALPGAEQAADDLAEQVADRVRAHGRDVDVLLEAGAPTSSQRALAALRRPRAGTAQTAAPSTPQVVSLGLRSDGFRLLAGRTEPVVAVVVPRGSDLRSIRRAVAPLRAAQTAVVLAP